MVYMTLCKPHSLGKVVFIDESIPWRLCLALLHGCRMYDRDRLRVTVSVTSHESCMNMMNVVINTSYQKLPFGSGDAPDKLFSHQALN